MADVDRDPARLPPAGVAGVRGFESDAQIREALLALVRQAARGAIERRERRGLISGRGDAASTLLLDRDRARALLEPAPGSPDDEALTRRRTSLLRRVSVTAADGPPLALALGRWRLAADEVVVLAATLAAAISPELSRLLAYVGGESSRVLTVEGAAALLGDGDAPILAIERMLASGSRLAAVGVVATGRRELPFLRQSLEAHPRLVSLAAGAREPADPRLELMTPAPLGASRLATEDADHLRAVAARESGERIGCIDGGAPAALAEELARLLALDGRPLLVAPLELLAELGAPGLAREALLAGAALALRCDARPAEASRYGRELDRVAAAVPTYLLGETDIPSRLERIAASLALDPPPRADPTLLWTDLEAPRWASPCPAPPPWSELELPEPVAAAMRDGARNVTSSGRSRSVVLFRGGAGLDRLSLAARFAADLGRRCLRLELGRLASALDRSALLDGVAQAAAAGAAIVIDADTATGSETALVGAALEHLAGAPGVFLVAFSGAAVPADVAGLADLSVRFDGGGSERALLDAFGIDIY